MHRLSIIILLWLCSALYPFFPGCPPVAGQTADGSSRLAAEVKNKGWILYSARSDNNTWDIFLSRPDGSQVRNITNTPDFEEAAPRLVNDGTKMLYRRLAKGITIDHDRWGFQGELMVSAPNGAGAETAGQDGEYPWASWMPDGKTIICLTLKGIQFVDLAAKKIVKQIPRQGIYQQLFISPDGKWFTGVANTLGMWTVVRMNAESGELNPIQKFQNCTPDWFPDSEHIIYSSRPANQKANDGYGWTQLLAAHGNGTGHRLLYGEEGFHIYGGTVSPDGAYILFTKCPEDGGGAELSGAPMCIMRLADTPAIRGESREMRALHPGTKDSPVLELTNGWEPVWTFAEIGE